MTRSGMTASKDLEPGTQLQHRDGRVVTLKVRKKPGEGSPALPFHPGWWLTDGSGLADFVVDANDSDWTFVSWSTDVVDQAVTEFLDSELDPDGYAGREGLSE